MHIAKGLTKDKVQYITFKLLKYYCCKKNCLNLLEQKARSSQFGGLQGA